MRTRLKNVADRKRALANVHLYDGWLPKIKKAKKNGRHDVLFIGDAKRSARFEKAVDLEIYQDDGLLRRTILSRDGRKLEWTGSPRWNSSLRPCRVVFDCADSTHKKHLDILIKAIEAKNPNLAHFWP